MATHILHMLDKSLSPRHLSSLSREHCILLATDLTSVIMAACHLLLLDKSTEARPRNMAQQLIRTLLA
jgi:hypothetical protein